MVAERDVVIVGAGIAGLTAALHLRDLSPLVLEAEGRVGGRILSKQRGDLALSVGAHMFPPPDSVVGRMVVGVRARGDADHGIDAQRLPAWKAHSRHQAGTLAPSAPSFPRRTDLVFQSRTTCQARRRPVHAADPTASGRHGREDPAAGAQASRRRDLRRLPRAPSSAGVRDLPGRSPTARSPSRTRSLSRRWRRYSDTSGTLATSAVTCVAARVGFRMRSARRSAAPCGSALAFSEVRLDGRRRARSL